MELLLNQKWIAILVFTNLWIILEAVWYSPKFCGTLYIKESCDKEKDTKATSLKCWIGALILAFFNLYALAFFNQLTEAETFTKGALNGFIVWIGFIATSHYQKVLWENESGTLFAINAGFKLITALLFGGLLSIW